MSEAPAAGLNLGFTPCDRRSNVEENRKLFLRAVNGERFSLATLHQVHSTRVYQVARFGGKIEYRLPGNSAVERSGAALPEGDALLTNEPGVLLSIRSADCMPVLLVDPRQRAVAAVHAGWRGALEGVIEKTVAEMRRLFASRPRDLVVAAGPFIRPCCYEVGEEVVEAFCSRFSNATSFFLKAPAPAATAAHLDLGAVTREQLRRSGVLASNIQMTELCTCCRTDLFFSHRKEGGQTGRMMAVIGIKPTT